ncbi:type II secretion system protein GspM [Pseudomonas sp. LRF_L74]|uniref:type II secretion system protein GspM n=1 Tax=Pseudomonas sp. LRF_L74 TaxID=3369422 RepID=UPI003F61234F
MNALLQRWRNLQAREQWLAYGVGLALLLALFMLLVADPLSTRLANREAAVRMALAQQQDVRVALAELQARAASDPNAPYTRALASAETAARQLLDRIDRSTRELIPPQQMRGVLQALLKRQQGLQLVAMESFSEPIRLDPLATTKPGEGQPEPASEVTLYRHGMHLTLEGGYFDLIAYLQAIQASGWQLNWDSLDYTVGEAGPGRAAISLTLYTLSRQAGWVGV